MRCRLKVPIIYARIHGFFGPQEAAAFERKTGAVVADDEGGCTVGQSFWVIDRKYMLHELEHVVDHIMSSYGIHSREFRAYLMDYVVTAFDKLVDRRQPRRKK